jgi:hypothetical protein
VKIIYTRFFQNYCRYASFGVIDMFLIQQHRNELLIEENGEERFLYVQKLDGCGCSLLYDAADMLDYVALTGKMVNGKVKLSSCLTN